MKGYNELLSSFEDYFIRKLKFDQKPIELYEPINYTLELGGKRIRPILCLMACEMFGKDAKDALNQAVAIEFFHNFTLIHDDIMDDAPIRRGKQSVFKKWNKNIAILSGDTLFALAYQYAQNVHKDIINEILYVFNATAIEVCEGQQLDLNFENDNQITLDDYMEMIRLKTAVLFGASVKIGAIIGGASSVYANYLYNFGVNIGLGFQLRDDLLDTFGDENITGKKTGGDILSNKKTYLYLKALELSNPKQREELTQLYNTSDIDSNEKIERVTSIFNALNIKILAIDYIHYHHRVGMQYLDKVGVSDMYKQNLTQIAKRMIDRSY